MSITRAMSLMLAVTAGGALIAGTASAQVSAQVGPGTVAGLIRDSTGGAVPGATIQITSEATGVAVNTVSDERGAYRVTSLAPGRYRVEAVLDGFETAVRRLALDPGQTAAVDVVLEPARLSEGIVVTARRVEEAVQEVPIPVSVLSGTLVADAGAFNVNRLKELVPTVQFYSSNPRNSAINIRGLGAPFGLTNDGIEPGVGLYIDGAFFARPAAATLDFLDVERIEVLRGPQGTLFGKNTTAGAINVTTRKPTFTRESDIEINYGSLGLVQGKASVSGPLSKSVAGRISFSGTTREGTIRHNASGLDLNGHNNLGARGQILFAPSDRLAITFAADNTRQRPDGHAQVVAGVAPTLRPANRQYQQIAADLGYAPPSFNAFDRTTDTDTPWRSYQDLGGASLTAERSIGRGRLTAITAWRYWNWRPSNDRDFIGLPVTTISANPSDQRQWTQEVRYAADVTPDLGFVVGAFGFRQTIDSTGRQEQGAAAARFLLAPTPAAATPGLLDGYGQTSDIASTTVSAALFGQLDWSVTDRLRLLPGLRVNYDEKSVEYDTQIYGGLQTSNASLVALQRSILAPQAYQADVDDANVSGQLTAAYRLAEGVNAFATYATSFKSVGLNLAGVPANAAGDPALEAATVKPEDERHVEIGIKTELRRGVTANLTVFNTDIRDYQAQVVNASVGVLRGYLANAERVRVRGVELDATARVNRRLSVYGSAAFTDGKYVSFPDAPPPLEETGGPQVKDISGSLLPGISRWAFSVGGEQVAPATVLGHSGELFGAVDASYRSSFSSSATASRYLVVDGYALVNARIGFRWSNGWAVSLWSRNLLNQNYYELISAAPGGSGLYVGLPGDPRTVGVTLRMALRRRN
jgi:iron complex outermembrane receptor protein